MAEWVVHGGRVRFSPGPGWSWSDFDGILTITVPERLMNVDGRPVTLAEDIESVKSGLETKKYTATGFDDLPGSVKRATIRVDSATLDEQVEDDGRRIVLSTTTGTFEVTCEPAANTKTSPPTLDLPGSHSGTWEVVTSGQALANTSA